METYIDLALLALITVYIVDLSGFTDSWRSALARFLKVGKLKALPPFDCGKCMTWWVCFIFLLIRGEVSLRTLAAAALLSFLSVPVGQGLILIREWLNTIINKLYPR